MRSGRFIDFYKVLQVDPDADAEVIEAAFRRLARKYHPDTNPRREAEEIMKQLTEAYEVLSDPRKRSEFDAIRRQAVRGGPGPAWGGRPEAGPPQTAAAAMIRKYIVRAIMITAIVLAWRVHPRLGAVLAVAAIIYFFLSAGRTRR
ncbi:MAG: DnaJ domain-containing protein [Pseudomonadota bacterium]